MGTWFSRVAFLHALLWALPLLFSAGCMHLNQNGKSADDSTALVCGILGIIAFFAGLNDKKSVWITVVGILLILA